MILVSFEVASLGVWPAWGYGQLEGGLRYNYRSSNIIISVPDDNPIISCLYNRLVSLYYYRLVYGLEIY
jgi:hypothetical protein